MGRITLLSSHLITLHTEIREGLTSIPLTWLFSELVWVLSGSGGLPELRQLDRIDTLKAARPGVGVLRRTLCFLGGPLSLSWLWPRP